MRPYNLTIIGADDEHAYVAHVPIGVVAYGLGCVRSSREWLDLDDFQVVRLAFR